MVVKCEKSVYISNIILLVALNIVSVSIVIVTEFMPALCLFSAGFSLFVTYYGVTQYLFHRRTLIFDSEGCTIQTEKETRKIEWKKIQIRKLEYYAERKWDPRRGIVFSTQPIEEGNYRPPGRYARIKRLWTCFYITFPPDERKKTYMRTYSTEDAFDEKYYEVDEKEFMNQLHEWGIVVKNELPREHRKMYFGDWI